MQLTDDDHHDGNGDLDGDENDSICPPSSLVSANFRMDSWMVG